MMCRQQVRNYLIALGQNIMASPVLPNQSNGALVSMNSGCTTFDPNYTHQYSCAVVNSFVNLFASSWNYNCNGIMNGLSTMNTGLTNVFVNLFGVLKQNNNYIGILRRIVISITPINIASLSVITSSLQAMVISFGPVNAVTTNAQNIIFSAQQFTQQHNKHRSL